MRICFIGGGNMASALIGGLLAGTTEASQLHVVEPDAGARERISQRFGVKSFETADAEALDVDVLVLAVKPQITRQVALGIATQIQRQLVISIAAGIRAGDLARWLGGHRRIVRTMPNTPALIGEGITALLGNAQLNEVDREMADQVLAAVGQTIWVEDESMIDAVTAVSGSGPAYVFYFMEAMHAAAVALGLSEVHARQLTLATFGGASHLAAISEEPPSILRERVTSKGGTTAAALSVMAEREVHKHIADALTAACKRSEELGDEFGRD